MSFRDRHPGTITDALTRSGTVISVRPDLCGDQQHTWWLPDGRLITQGLGDIPNHCPYQAGDRVQCHGHPGSAYQMRRDGWRGIVLGHLGAQLLEGITDDGRPWVESWGALTPDGVPERGAVACTCCPHRPVRRARPVAEQGELFTFADVVSGVAA